MTEPTDLDTTIDFTSDGEYEDHDEVKIVITRSQLNALADTILSNVDLDTVGLDNGEPARAEFIERFAREALAALATPTRPS